LRAGTRLGPGVKIGDFVEVKNATFGAGAQASHLSYVGDADVGAGTNIGAGTVTCNYDGFRKHRTVIGAGAFIGSNSTLIAPLTVGDGAFIAAGSSISEDVPGDAMAIARSRATIKEGRAARYRAERRQPRDQPPE
jgi:bifunctional UDP-N-acetylglucosamine pyrophosphorylase/glucosamine-1-phosphate N-acetyltransferase